MNQASKHIYRYGGKRTPWCSSLEYLGIMNVYVALASQMAIMTKYKS